jgi:hypothetical protein
MRLLPFAAAPPDAVRSFSADGAWRADGSLWLSYRLQAETALLRVAGPAGALRADGLWRHTCFEAFVAPADGARYCEFNFSPSGQWAAYAFDAYRAGMRTLELRTPPRARWQHDAGGLSLDVGIGIAEILGPGAPAPLRLGLAAVIEEQSGTISHWALRHPTDRPDFHRHEGFVLELAAPANGAGGTRAT